MQLTHFFWDSNRGFLISEATALPTAASCFEHIDCSFHIERVCWLHYMKMTRHEKFITGFIHISSLSWIDTYIKNYVIKNSWCKTQFWLPDLQAVRACSLYVYTRSLWFRAIACGVRWPGFNAGSFQLCKLFHRRKIGEPANLKLLKVSAHSDSNEINPICAARGNNNMN